jgi:REP element-mobilizing transposase RayT
MASHTFRVHYFHIVWSTKLRKNITPEIKERLYSYIAGIVKNQEQLLICIGGTANHVHLLIRFSRLEKFSNIIRDLKSKSTMWIHENFPEHQLFKWQEGYSSFSVSHSIVSKIKLYIKNQEEHHRKLTFEEELQKILKKHEIECNDYMFG